MHAQQAASLHPSASFVTLTEREMFAESVGAIGVDFDDVDLLPPGAARSQLQLSLFCRLDGMVQMHDKVGAARMLGES